MLGLLAKRIPREIKSNPVKYIALLFVMILSIYIICCFAISYDSMIYANTQTAEEDHLEDGDFTVFIQLSDDQIKQIESDGVTIQKQFYSDITYNDTKTLRFFQVRDSIDNVTIDQGSMPSLKNQAVVDIRFAEANNLQVGDQITVGGNALIICGIGYTPDYNQPLQNLTDPIGNSNDFGLVFMTAEGYQAIVSSTQASEIYNYSYLLNGAMTDKQLKAEIAAMDFDYHQVTDPYYQAAIADATEEQQKVKDTTASLYSGAQSLTAGIKSLYDNSASLVQSASDLQTASEELSAGADELDASINEVSSSLNSKQEDLTRIKDAGSQIRTSLDTYTKKLFAYISQNVSALMAEDITLTEDNYEEALDQLIADNPISILNDYLVKAKTQLKEALTFRDSLIAYTEAADAAADDVSGMRTSLNAIAAGADTLSANGQTYAQQMKEFTAAVKSYTDGVEKIYTGSTQLETSIGELDTALGSALEKSKSSALNNIETFVERSNNARIFASRKRAQTYRTIILMLGAAILILVSYILSVFVLQQLNRDVKNVGALYALGVSKREVLLHYITLPVLIAAGGSLIGMGLACLPVHIVDGYHLMVDNYLVSSMHMIIPAYLIVGCLILPPVIAAGVNTLAVNSYLSRNAVALLNNEQMIRRTRPLKFLNNLSFIPMFQVRQMVRETRTYKTVVFGVVNSMLVVMFGIGIHYMAGFTGYQSIQDMKYEYMYVLKYPQKSLPEDGEAAYVKSLKYSFVGSKTNVTLIGLSDDSSYFPAQPVEGENQLTISSAMATKFLLHQGSQIILNDASTDRDYVFYVHDIVNYDAGVAVFMNIDSMRSLFNTSSTFFNTIYSDHELKIDQGLIYSSISKQEVVNMSKTFVSQIVPIEVMILVIGFMNMGLILYILIGIIIDRAAYSISLIKIFGYDRKEIRRLFLDGAFYVILIAIVIGIPVSWLLTQIMLTFSMLNFEVGMHFSIPWYTFAGFAAAVLVIYFIVSMLLNKRFNRVPLTEALKSRG